MSDEGLESFEMSDMPEPEIPPLPERRASTVADRRYLCITVVDHQAILDDTGDESYINLRIPVALADAGLKMVPSGKLGNLDPELIVEMIEEGATGELINITERNKTVSVRVE